MKERLRALGRRWPLLGRLLDLLERVGEVNGGLVSASVTLTIFVSIFPLMLVAIAVVGFLAAGDETVAPRLIENLGLSGTAAETLERAVDTASDSRQAASVVGLVGLAWSGSAVAVALQQAVRAPWQERSQGIVDRLKGMAWLVVAALGFAAAIALGGVLNFLPDELPKPLLMVAAILVGLAAEVALFWWMFWGLGTRRVGGRDLLPGAILAGVGFEILKLVGTIYVPRLVASSSSLYGPLGVVFAILAWLAFFARLIIYSSTLNAVLYERREGTVEVPIHAPRIPGFKAAGATRGGVVLSEADDDPAVPDPAPDSIAESMAEQDGEPPSVDVVTTATDKSAGDRE